MYVSHFYAITISRLMLTYKPVSLKSFLNMMYIALVKFS